MLNTRKLHSDVSICIIYASEYVYYMAYYTEHSHIDMHISLLASWIAAVHLIISSSVRTVEGLFEASVLGRPPV